MSPNRHCLQAFILSCDSTSLNGSPVNKDDPQQESILLPNLNNAHYALKALEKRMDSNSPAVVIKYRPQLEKLGAVSVQQGSVTKTKYEFQKLVKHMKSLNQKIFEVEKTFAEWINTFESDDIAIFATEVEKFMKIQAEFNKSITDKLEFLTTSLTSLIDVETTRNTMMTKYLKCKRERDEFKRKNLDLLALNKFEDKVIQSYSAVSTSQMLYETNVHRSVRPALFGYCAAFQSIGEKLNNLCDKTALDIKSFNNTIHHKNFMNDFYHNISDLSVNNVKESTPENTFEIMLVQRPNHGNEPEEPSKSVKKNQQNGNSANSDELSEFESGPEENIENINNELYYNNIYGYSPENKNDPNMYKSPFYKETTMLNIKKVPEKDFHNTNIKKSHNNNHERTNLVQRDIPNDTNNFDSTENYLTFVNEKTKKDPNIKYAGPINNDNSVTDMWKS